MTTAEDGWCKTPALQGVAACAAAVEDSLAKSGVLLSMGGEPTFVPRVGDGAEWFTDALGPTKRGRARRFAHQFIRDSFPGAALLETTGKHYPGEPLPRWALLVQHRTDAQPAWRDLTLLREDDEPGSHRLTDARRFVRALAGGLGVGVATIIEGREAARGAKGAGLILPLDRAPEGGWRTDDWRPALKRKFAVLHPGDSLLGLRLPLGGLTDENLRRALTAEVRNGSLTIFVPPLAAPDYLALLAQIEDALVAEKLRDAVLAGYVPPPSPLLTTIGFASDPGVIEVNLAPCENWATYDRQLGQLYDAAGKTGLCARKLALNGRVTGTGGGAHLVFGGPQGHTSPFFVHPGLLPSIIRYWQHHPALSFAFTGQYMGPSSQAPRIDESTFEALYELEIAMDGAARLGSARNLALFDLLFRDLLMDRSGNGHRAEISVDKLWNPASANGQLGLVEFRAFESHPDRTALAVTGLFVRAILARLAADPFREPFRRWGGELHDRFFVPTFVHDDLAGIVADLNAHGIPFQAAWILELWEWRFPRLGALKLPGAPGRPSFAVEFRQALEAWPLLGEQSSSGGTSRTVDSSADRIEAALADAGAADQGVLLVNGLPCEFRRNEAGGAAAGIRFRAFHLHPALHPHVPVHAPLLLEWVDRRTMQVVAAARWHVWNPRAHAYADRPRDEAEAARRHAERWEDWPATIGQTRGIERVDFPPEGKHTLDLRRYTPSGGERVTLNV